MTGVQTCALPISSRGIGRETALQLAREGATVVINYAMSADEATKVVNLIEAAGGRAVAIQADIGKVADIQRFFCEANERLGRLDIVVANAGVSSFKPLSDITEAEFDRMFAVNAKGTFFCLQEALRYLVDGGRIICVSTIGTVLNVPGGTCYFGSKAAIEQFCRTLAKEIAPRGITVNVVSPGFTETQMLLATMDAATHAALVAMTPLNRLGAPQEIAEVISFLASDGARWVNRQNIAVDGGIISR